MRVYEGKQMTFSKSKISDHSRGLEHGWLFVRGRDGEAAFLPLRRALQLPGFRRVNPGSGYGQKGFIMKHKMK